MPSIREARARPVVSTDAALFGRIGHAPTLERTGQPITWPAAKRLADGRRVPFVILANLLSKSAVVSPAGWERKLLHVGGVVSSLVGEAAGSLEHDGEE